MSGRQLDWEHLEELECPVCKQYMTSPIKMCENGHNMCGGCTERLSECPTCRAKFNNFRNVSLEKFAATVLYPCKNWEAGCKDTFTMDNRNKHLSVCLYRSRKCPVSIISSEDCSWAGILSNLEAHIEYKHSWEVFRVPNHFVMELHNLARGFNYSLAVFTLKELFYMDLKAEGDAFKFGVCHIGPVEKTEFFKYGIKIGSFEEHISVTRKCYSHLEGDTMDLKSEKCVMIYYDTILDFVDERGNLSCEFEIGREKLNGFLLKEPRKSAYKILVHGSLQKDCWFQFRPIQSHSS
jgi:E3 ubiquitin-protein ligase SIAH1